MCNIEYLMFFGSIRRSFRSLTMVENAVYTILPLFAGFLQSENLDGLALVVPLLSFLGIVEYIIGYKERGDLPMIITNSYLGISQGEYNYLFYVLYQNYNETQMTFMKEIDNLLTGFARDLGKDAVVVKPFIDDIGQTKQEILCKNWSERAESQIANTPGMLMLNTDLAHFDPNNDPWFYFHFGNRANERNLSNLVRFDTIDKVDKAFIQLKEFAKNSNVDIFAEAAKMRTSMANEALGIIEAKPGIFGFSVDLVEGFRFVKSLFEKK